MPRWSLYLSLPVAGAVAALLAFFAASPFIPTLDKPGVPASDPGASYSTGTTWDVVVHVVFGALLLGSFAFLVRATERGVRRSVPVGVLAAVVGAVLVPLANSGSDAIGIASDRANGFGGFAGAVAWCAAVPSVLAYSLAFVLGMTPQRSARAFSASIVGFFAGLIVQFLVGPALAVATALSSPGGIGALTQGPPSLRSGIPQWQTMDVVIGVTLGLLSAYSQDRFRSAWLRLVAGRNEFRDWNLDFLVNRIGAQEGLEVSVRGLPGLAPVHAEIVRRQGGFVFRDLIGGATVNGVPVQQAWLRDGDQVAVGGALFVFGSRGGAPRRASATPLAPVGNAPAGPEVAPVLKPVDAPLPRIGHRLADGFGQVYGLPPGKLTIGRDAANGIALAWDAGVSRSHGEFQTDDSGVTYRDLGSSNGSRVNGRPVTEARLSPGDVIELGSTSLRYDAGI
ncbi:MAG: FHA domain-containing protein [Armatimonadetes bacterium]|nr:FHA domain-containing protein [Armatimonadota bacterium]